MDFEAYTAYAGLITVATTSVYAGSRGSLKISPPGGAKAQHDDDIPRLTSGDAWLFPVLGSIALLGLFLIIKFLGPEWINWFMSWYFFIAAMYSMPDMFIRLVRFVIGQERWESLPLHRITLIKTKLILIWGQWRTPSYLLIPLAVLPSVYFQLTSTKKPALLTDVMALSFAHEAMSLLKLDSWSTGCILLSGLFVYDIWWVFGTKVMVSVATSLDVPIKLLWPKSLTDLSAGFMMLGLGDIVVPGLFVALSLRFDYHLFRQSGGKGASFPKPYFTACVAAYVIGLAVTMMVMHSFNAAQPALLYLSPACILAFLMTSLFRGELEEAWKWTDGEK